MVFAKAQLFDFTSLRQGQFLANDGEKAEKADFKKHRARIHKGDFFTTVKIPTLGLDGASPKPQKQDQKQNGTRFARVFSKAKAHDS